MKKLFITLIFFAALYHTAYSAPIHTYREEIPISDSITLTKVRDFYADFGITYSYIKADLTDENTSLKLLRSSAGTDVLETVGNLAATDPNTVAALNADFFSPFSGTKAFALGIEVKDGILEESPINPGTMASIISTDDTVTMSYLDFHIMAVAPNWQYNEIRHLNKHTSYYGDILMYTSSFNGGMSPAPGGEVLEVVVTDGVITEFRRNMPPVAIPENGCVLVVSEGSNMFFANNFNVGDPIRFDYYITPDISNAQTAFGGGAMLVSDGKAVTSYSHVISGYQPRSAIGVDKNGTTLWLVAVDGRQSGSRGMSMSELSNLMLSLGCHQAVNLDGGGSTRMVASTLLNPSMSPVNSPTENRKVINAAAVTFNAPAGEAAGITVNPGQSAVFIGETAIFTAVIHDENMRPVNGSVNWSSDFGTVNNGVFCPNKGGNATVNANFGNASGQAEIFVIDTVSGIETDSRIFLSKNEEKVFNIHVFDNLGHYAEVTGTDRFAISSSDPSIVSVSGRTLKAHKDGTAIITIKKDGAESHISVAVGAEVKEHTDDFETLNGSFKSYPKTVPGSFELSSEHSQSGNLSGKLSFDFTDEEEVSKGAYYALTERIQLHDSSDTVSVSMYTDTPIDHELRAQFVDANGSIVIASFGKDFKIGEWNRLVASVPENALRPLRLDRIYVLYLPGEAKDLGCVYIDDLKLDSVTPTPYVSAPLNTYDITDFRGNAHFSAGAMLTDNKTLFVRLANKETKEYLSSRPSSALIGQIGGFSTREDDNALYIQLDTSKGGIRATDSGQWSKMSSAISGTNKSRVFILSDNSVFGSSDYENKVLHDYLASTGKEVFVITGGDSNSCKNIDGVTYFTLNLRSDTVLDLTGIDSCVCLDFNFGATTTFRWKKMF